MIGQLMEPLNPYDILGVTRTSSPEEIKKAYRSLAQRHHPDHGGDEDEFVRIKLAYETLSDPYKRRMYDQTGIFQGKRTKKDEAIHELGILINWFLPRFDYEHENLLDRVHREVDQGLHELNENKNRLVRENTKLEFMSKFIKHKKNNNYIGRHLRSRIDQNTYEIKKLEERIELFKLVKELANDHYYE